MVGNVIYITNKDNEDNIKYKFYLIFDKILESNKVSRNDVSSSYYLLIDIEGKITKEEPDAFINGIYKFAANTRKYEDFSSFCREIFVIESSINKKN